MSPWGVPSTQHPCPAALRQLMPSWGVSPGLWFSTQGVPGMQCHWGVGCWVPPMGRHGSCRQHSAGLCPQVVFHRLQPPDSAETLPWAWGWAGGSAGWGRPPAATLLPPSPAPGPTGWGLAGWGAPRRGGAETRLHSSHMSHRRRRATSRFCLSVCLSRPPQHGRDSSSDGSWSDTVGSAGCWVPAIPGVSAGADGDTHGRDPT